jgi:hypothetical protein
MAVLLVAGCLAATSARAKSCGDDVDGADVPCACGDVVVSSVVLGDDPVVNGPPCLHDGLIVRAPDARRALVIDLHGTKLRGSGAGVGIRIVAGGPGGARLLSSGGAAAVMGFEDGVVARGTDSAALIEDVVVSESGRDGLRVSGPEFTIRRVEVHGARRDGFALGGRGFQIAATRASDCGRYGYSVMGDSGQIGQPGAGNLAERSGWAGFSIMGAGHALSDCTAMFGRRSGVHLQAVQIEVRGCQASDNGGDGIEGMGNRWRIAGNEALRNAGNGIVVRGVELLDEGGNRGADNQGVERELGPVQCAIAGAPCVL